MDRHARTKQNQARMMDIIVSNCLVLSKPLKRPAGEAFMKRQYNGNMAVLSEKNYHRLFTWGVWAKTAIAIGETVLGFLLYAVSTETITAVIYRYLGGELQEVPRDRIWDILLRGLEGLSGGGQPFWAFILLSHGLVKLFLLGGLIKNKLWAYPASAAVFTLLALYQLYTLLQGPDLLLELITILDIIVIALIAHEWRRKKKISTHPRLL